MNTRRLLAFAVGASALALGAVAVVFILAADAGERRPGADDSRTGAGASAPARGQILAKLRRDAREHAAGSHRERTHEIVGDPSAELDSRRSGTRAYADERRAAELVARRFLAAFAHYELGRLTPRIERALLATGTAAFARELLAVTPRSAAGSDPPLARLGDLDFVAGGTHGGELVSLELVGEVMRGDRRTPLALELRRGAGGWRVEALGR